MGVGRDRLLLFGDVVVPQDARDGGEAGDADDADACYCDDVGGGDGPDR